MQLLLTRGNALPLEELAVLAQPDLSTCLPLGSYDNNNKKKR